MKYSLTFIATLVCEYIFVVADYEILQPEKWSWVEETVLLLSWRYCILFVKTFLVGLRAEPQDKGILLNSKY